MQIRTPFVGVDAHIDPHNARPFLRYVAANLPLPHGRTGSSAPTGRCAGSPKMPAILQLPTAGSMWASTPTDVLRCRRLLYGIVGAFCAGGVEALPYAGLVDSVRSPKGRANLQVPTAQSFSRLRRQHPYPLCPFGAFPPDRGNRPFAQGSLYGGAIWQCIQKGSRNAAASLFYRFRVLVLWSA